jgi:hypothetical protein
MSLLTLKRTDKFYQQKSYLNIYNVQDLSKIDSNIKPLLLRVVKKSILGTNFFHFYTKHSLYFSTILNIIMTNLNFFIFPKIFQQTKQFSFYFNDDENNSIETHENNKNINLVNNTKYMMFDIFRKEYNKGIKEGQHCQFTTEKCEDLCEIIIKKAALVYQVNRKEE